MNFAKGVNRLISFAATDARACTYPQHQRGGLREDAHHFDCGCPGAWWLTKVKTSHVENGRLFMLGDLVWDVWYSHSKECRRRHVER